MSFQTFVGQITQPTATNASFAVTGVGFVPKALILYGVDKTADGSAINIEIFTGMATSTSSRVALATGASSAATDDRYHDNTKCFVVTSIAQTVLVAADLVSFDSDGFTLNFSTVDTNARKINFIALGGSDITNVTILKFDQSASTGNQALTGVGFKPDALILMSPSTTTAPPGGDTASGGDTIISFSDTAKNTLAYGADISDSNLLSSQFISRPSGGNISTFRYQATLVSYDADGFTLNWGSASARTCYVLCIKGGSFKVGVFNQPAATGNAATTGIGFTPTGIVLMSQDAASSSAVQQNARKISLGASSGTTHRGCVWNGSDASNWNQNLDQLNAIKMLTPGAVGVPTLNAVADFVSLDSDGFTLNWTTADATARQVGYMAFGNTPISTGFLGARSLLGVGR